MKNLILLILFSAALMSSTCETSSSGSGGSGSGGINNNINCPAPGNSTHHHANAKLQWNWTSTDLYNVDQRFQIFQFSPSSFWSLRFMAGDNSLGHFGIKSDASGEGSKAKVIFSLWGGNDCQVGNAGGLCGNTGIISGRKITVPFNFYEGDEYRFRVWYLGNENGGDWWGAWLLNISSNTEYYIGKIRISAGTRLNTTENVIEYNGGSFANIACVPKSISKYYPPTANHSYASYQYKSTFYSYDIGNGANGSVGQFSGAKQVILGGE